MNERATIAYQPALDGVRALAVAAVLLFHAEVPGFDGGYLGVSVFFTLSGYLITSLLVHEHDRTGRIDLARFYGRRVRRLLPASVLCLAAIVVLASTTDLFDGVADLRREIIGSILQVANWVFLAGEGSYQELFQQVSGERSPLEHFWSLAIEEQFYWIWPPSILAILSIARSRRARLVITGSVTAAFALAAPAIAAIWGSDAAYWATPARIAEILMGALLALALSGRVAAPGVGVLAPVALAGLAACTVLFPSSGGPAYEGWLPLIAVLSAALVLGLQVDGPVRTALSLAPFVWLGRISYGVYLFHWPIYLIADERRTGLDGPVLVAVQLALTLTIAQLSFSLFEQPIRRASGLGGRITFGGGATATATIAVAAIVVIPAGSASYWLADDDVAGAAAIVVDDEPLDAVAVASTVVPAPPGSDPAPTATSEVAGDVISDDGDGGTGAATTSTTEPPLTDLTRPVRIVVAGDSTAEATGSGLVAWAAAHPELAQVEVVADPGCGLVRAGERRVGVWEDVPERCDRWIDERLPERVAELQPDVVALMVTSWDVLNRRWDGETQLTPLDPEYATRIAADYRAITTDLLDVGAGSIAWISAPLPNVQWMYQGTGQEDPARHAVVHAAIGDIVAAQRGDVYVIGLDEWLDASDLAEDRDVRPDGVHWAPPAAADIAEQFLGEQLVRAALGMELP